MKRVPLFLLYGYLIASLCGFLEPFGNLAFCESGQDWGKDWMTKEKGAFQAGRYYFSKATEIVNYYSKAREKNPNLVAKQEKWVRERVRSGKSADLLERREEE